MKARVPVDMFIASPEEVKSNNDTNTGMSIKTTYYRRPDFNDIAMLLDLVDRSGGEMSILNRDIFGDAYSALSASGGTGSRGCIARLAKRIWHRISSIIATDVSFLFL